MAAQYFHFPTSTTTYKLPSGDTLRFRLWYDDGTALSNTNTDVKLMKCGALDIPLEATPSSQTFRFSKMKLVFENTGDRFDTGDIFDATYANDTYIELYLNGSLYFYGMVDFASIKRSEWYVSGGTLKSRSISFEILDIMSYFWTRSRTLTDVSITLPDHLDDILELIFADVGISAGNVNVDTNIGWTEYAGGATHTLSTLLLDSAAGDPECSVWLKYMMLYFGCFIYFLNGKINIVSRIAGTTKTVNISDLVNPIDKIENQDIIEYIRLRVEGNALLDAPISDIDTTADTITMTSGTDNGNNARNFDIGIEQTFTKHIYSVGTSTRYPTSGNAGMTGGSTTTLEDTSETFQTDDWESGDYVYNATDSEGAMVYNVNSETVFLHSLMGAVNNNLDLWYGYKGGDTNNKRWKFYKICEAANDIYAEFFQTSNDVLKIRVRDLTDFDDIEKRFVLLSANHRAKKAKIEFENDEIQFELKQVA